MKRSAARVFPSQRSTLARKEWIITETLTVMAAATARAAIVTALRCRERTRCWEANRTIQPGPVATRTKSRTTNGTRREKPAMRNPTAAKPRSRPPWRSASQERTNARRRHATPHGAQPRAESAPSPMEPWRKTTAGSHEAASRAGLQAARSEAPNPQAKARAICRGVIWTRSMLTSA